MTNPTYTPFSLSKVAEYLLTKATQNVPLYDAALVSHLIALSARKEATLRQPLLQVCQRSSRVLTTETKAWFDDITAMIQLKVYRLMHPLRSASGNNNASTNLSKSVGRSPSSGSLPLCSAYSSRCTWEFDMPDMQVGFWDGKPREIFRR
jgi:hypothetical protein